jgi:hypothetical protein
MIQTLLFIGGITQVAFSLFHIYLEKIIHAMEEISREGRALYHAFNIAGIVTIAYFAIAFLFFGAKILKSELGLLLLALIALYYLFRAFEEVVLFKFNPAIFSTCLIVGSIYATVLGLTL